jgi:hypothetical protein
MELKSQVFSFTGLENNKLKCFIISTILDISKSLVLSKERFGK